MPRSVVGQACRSGRSGDRFADLVGSARWGRGDQQQIRLSGAIAARARRVAPRRCGCHLRRVVERKRRDTDHLKRWAAIGRRTAARHSASLFRQAVARGRLPATIEEHLPGEIAAAGQVASFDHGPGGGPKHRPRKRDRYRSARSAGVINVAEQRGLPHTPAAAARPPPSRRVRFRDCVALTRWRTRRTE